MNAFRRVSRLFLISCIAAVLFAALSGCGNKGDLVRPGQPAQSSDG